MAQLTNNVSVFKVPNVSEFGANQDGISGLILLTPIAAWSALVADMPYKWRSLRDAEAAGLTLLRRLRTHRPGLYPRTGVLSLQPQRYALGDHQRERH